jgi:hypothetical protein
MIPEIGDWEVVPVLQRYNTSAVMFGLPEANPGKIPGFRGSVWGVGQMMSPVPESSPELYWSQGILHTSEMSDPKTNARTVHGYEGADALRELIGPINRSRIHVLHMELASEQDYFKPDFAKTSTTPSLAYAYAHPGQSEGARGGTIERGRGQCRIRQRGCGVEMAGGGLFSRRTPGAALYRAATSSAWRFPAPAIRSRLLR